MSLRRIAICAVGIGAILLTAPTTASADIGDNLPVGANPQAWRTYVEDYRAGPDWSPQGAVVADSGFRAHPDGFSFFNTGVPDAMNNLVFGTSRKGPKNLDAAAMRSLMGKRVCLEKQTTGPCTLTLAARQWMDSANESMAGGHCFGFASTAAELFNRMLAPAQFQPGILRTYDLGLQTPVARQIARNMASQYAMDILEYRTSPRQAVTLLRQSLRPGVLPYTLYILWGGGGHALTPYAVHDRGSGEYDIAVYDNNYPDADRAIRVDTVKNTYKYLVMTNPNGEPEIADGVIGLIPTEVIAQRQKCPFCPGANETTVQLTPVKSRVPIPTRITDLDGNKIKGVVANKPTNPWQPGQKWEFPTYVVPRKQDFVIVINARRSRVPVRTNVLAATGQFSVGTEGATVPPRGKGAVGLVPEKGLIVYGTDRDAELGALSFVDSRPAVEVQVLAGALSKGGSFLVGRLNEHSKKVVLLTADGRAGSARAVATMAFADARRVPVEVRASLAVTLPRRARLVVDYSAWSAQNRTGVTAFVKSAGHRKRVAVTFKR